MEIESFLTLDSQVPGTIFCTKTFLASYWWCCQTTVEVMMYPASNILSPSLSFIPTKFVSVYVGVVINSNCGLGSIVLKVRVNPMFWRVDTGHVNHLNYKKTFGELSLGPLGPFAIRLSLFNCRCVELSVCMPVCVCIEFYMATRSVNFLLEYLFVYTCFNCCEY